MGRERLLYLDSIRGLAAMIVCTSHLAATSQTLQVFDISGLKLFLASGFAVNLFFVLSGFVLFQQLQSERPGYLSFVVRRSFRLFPPCIVAVTASYLIYVLWSPAPAPQLTPWFNDVSWPPGITPDQYLMHLTLTGETSLLRPIWSLVYEWRISLIFPLLAAIFLYSPATVSAVVFGLALLLAKTTFWHEHPASWVLYTAFYVSLFLAGSAISRYRSDLVKVLGSLPWLRYALLAGVVYSICIRPQRDGLIGLLYVGIVAAVLISVCVSDRGLQKVLQVRPFVFLGRISYSLYLWHMIVIGTLFRVMDGISPFVVGAICIFVSVIIAWAMQILVESPSIKLGRMVSQVTNTAWKTSRALR
jgi:peptidoglycan/LPS O-acetylase OafA/YrhL